MVVSEKAAVVAGHDVIAENKLAAGREKVSSAKVAAIANFYLVKALNALIDIQPRIFANYTIVANCNILPAKNLYASVDEGVFACFFICQQQSDFAAQKIQAAIQAGRQQTAQQVFNFFEAFAEFARNPGFFSEKNFMQFMPDRWLFFGFFTERP